MLFVNLRQISPTINDRLEQLSTNFALSQKNLFDKFRQIPPFHDKIRQDSFVILTQFDKFRFLLRIFDKIRPVWGNPFDKIRQIIQFYDRSLVDSWRWLSEFVDYRRYSTKFQSSCFTSLYLLCKYAL